MRGEYDVNRVIDLRPIADRERRPLGRHTHLHEHIELVIERPRILRGAGFPPPADGFPLINLLFGAMVGASQRDLAVRRR
jgi:hypothetical protein